VDQPELAGGAKISALILIKVFKPSACDVLAEQSRKALTLTHTPHQLTEEFPAHADLIHALRLRDPHFAALAEAYSMVNDDVHLAETLAHPTTSEQEKELRTRRMQIKDQIWHLLKAAATGPT
jgi:uncharacterized protein